MIVQYIQFKTELSAKMCDEDDLSPTHRASFYFRVEKKSNQKMLLQLLLVITAASSIRASLSC